jgi:hypothetical protein
MKKVKFIPSLTGGGAERVAVNLFKALNFNYIIVLDDREIYYNVPREKIIFLKFPAWVDFRLPSLEALKHQLKEGWYIFLHLYRAIFCLLVVFLYWDFSQVKK